MKHSIKLFAACRQRVGRDRIEVELPAGATVGQLRLALAEQCPPLGEMLAHARFAIDNDYASENAVVGEKGEVAIIPPVSGG